jgi:lipid-A-disaccharide synthase
VRVFFSTGEPSGEFHAVALAREMQRVSAHALAFEGIGGERMRRAGFDVRVDTSGWASLGWLEAVGKIPRLLAIMLATATRLRVRPPALVVLVDFGAFNLRLARQLRRTGYRGPIVYYIPPGAWLDRPSQAKKVAEATIPLTVFAHQREFYHGLGLRVEFFGHPLASLVEARAPRPTAPTDGGTVALLPGSRHAEIERHLPVLLEAVATLRRERPHARFTIGAASAAIREEIAKRTTLEIVDGAEAALAHADAAWIASGTAVLEAALLGVPSMLFYITSDAQARMARRMYARIGGRYIGLPNLVLGRGVIPELWQEEATPQALVEGMRTLLGDPAPQLRELEALRPALGPPDALERCARFVLDAATC